MSLLPLTSFYAGGKQDDDLIRQYFTLIVSIHLYIVIFVSLHFSSLVFLFQKMDILLSSSSSSSSHWCATWAFRRSSFEWRYIYIYVYKCMYVFISILYNNVHPFSWDFALTYERFPLTFRFNSCVICICTCCTCIYASVI